MKSECTKDTMQNKTSFFAGRYDVGCRKSFFLFNLGGAGKLEHLYDAVVIGKASAVLAASIFHFGEISIPEAKRYLKERGILVKT